ncbi:caspase, EACC1-associated type [Actinoplanes solisilvae]|uniref:caspase, EACC1-associated type n=1 Tax=Actinoplanes solisilvae TaxID=2486853 RepID=UPI0013E361C9|nr:caspase family protein [Actinoplanes solisilvae]
MLGCSTFADPSLARLRSPRTDIEELARLLRDPDHCRYEVATEVDCSSQRARREIESFFAGATFGDAMNLLYLTCHGVQDNQGRLYFAFTDTERDLLGSTAVSAEWVRECVHNSRSKATLILVDCCFSGGFIKGMQARSGGPNVETLVQDMPRSTGLAVLTASGETEASFENSESADVRPSYFTDALINGISSGAADRDRDGRVTVDELYDHIYEQIVNGPSPQRPRRLGVGEGVLVVADAPTTTPSAEIRRTRLLAHGIQGWVSFDGETAIVGKLTLANKPKGEHRFPVGRLSGVVIKHATRLQHGFLQLVVGGAAPAASQQGTLDFTKSANEDMARLHDAIQSAIDATHGRPPLEPEPTVISPAAASIEPTSYPPAAPPWTSPATPDTTARPAAPAGRPDPRADRRNGERDGEQAARIIPMATLDGLAVCQFDVVRWLAPWRQHWAQALGRPATVPVWLPIIAQHIGGHAAPPGTTASTFYPTPEYLVGFCSGMRTTWDRATADRLFPADRSTLAGWMTYPTDWLSLGKPFAAATIDDLATARRRARRAKTRQTALRTVLWVAASLFLIMEIGAIGATFQGDWTDEQGKPIGNPVAVAIAAHLMFLLPLAGLSFLIALDLRRSRRK